MNPKKQIPEQLKMTMRMSSHPLPQYPAQTADAPLATLVARKVQIMIRGESSPGYLVS